MATAVFFHAHPDDEAIATSGTMMLAAQAGHRVVLVCATDGALGEANPDTVPDGSTLAEVRSVELLRAAEVIGVDRVEMLGYGDSGMIGEASNDHPDCFWQAPIEDAARRLADILIDEKASVLTTYDDHGNYGHPDHIQVHRVGVRAAEIADTEAVFEATMNRDRLRALADDASLSEIDAGEGADDVESRRAEIRETDMGTPAASITHAIDVMSVIDRKRLTLAEHRSQIDETSFFMALPSEAFAAAFGTEWFIRRGAAAGGPPYSTDLFDTLEKQ